MLGLGLRKKAIKATLAATRLLIRLGRKVGIFKPEVNSLLLIPAAPTPGGLGDEAMILSIIANLEEWKVDLLDPTSAGGWRGFDRVRRVVEYSAEGQSLLKNSLNFCRLANQYQAIGVIGADIMDGGYDNKVSLERLEWLDSAAKMGLSTHLFGFSWNEKSPKIIQDRIRSLSSTINIYLRDRISLERFQKSTGRNGVLVADVAFLLPIDDIKEGDSHVQSWCRDQKGSGQKLIGINIGTHACYENPNGVESSLGVFEAALRNTMMRHPEISILLMPHDLRIDSQGWSDQILAERLLQMLHENYPERIALHPSTLGAQAVKQTASFLDLLVTCRMHCAIAALGRGVPAKGIIYQSKFEGLYELFGMKNMTFNPVDLQSSNQFEEFIEDGICEQARLQNQVKAALPTVFQLSSKNFSSLKNSRVPGK